MIKAFRDTWELGIHSYLTYLRDRLLLARELLTESGSVFVQISDENVHHVREICDEVFGRENFCGMIAFQKSGGSTATKIEVVTEGIFTRQILNNPELKNISLVIFDEFHERSIHTDIGLALALDVQSVLRDDLKILIMSATLDPKKISVLFDKVKTVECEGRMFDVKTE